MKGQKFLNPKSNVTHANFSSNQTVRQRWQEMNESDDCRYIRGYNGQLVRRLDPEQAQRLRNAQP